MDITVSTILSDCILLSQDIRKQSHNFIKLMTLKKYLKEFGTIRLSLPRQSGHSFAAKNIIPSFFKKGKYAVIVPTHTMKRNFANEKIYTIDEFLTTEHYTIFECLCIDCASFVSQSKIDQLYDLSCLNFNSLIIFLE
jgi:hypothetical protein